MATLATLGVCLSLASMPYVPALFLPVQAFTLAWEHSIEHVRWEEDYKIEALNKEPGAQLIAVAARIKGSGAGMEPPDNAKLHNGWYEYPPTNSKPAILRLMRSEYTPDYEWCSQGGSQPLSALMPADGDITLVYACSTESP